MARIAKIDSDTLICLIGQFYAEKCDCDPRLLHIPKIGEYIRAEGYDVADYIIRRNDDARAYIKKLKEKTKENSIQTVAIYRDIDMDAFLNKNNTKDKIKKALKERENYYREVTNSASYSFKENKRLEQQVKELRKCIMELEEELNTSVAKVTAINAENRNYKLEIKKLRDIINTYVYPDIANQLLKEQGLVKNNASFINPEVVKNEIVTADTDITEIKSNVIKGLFDSI